MNTAEGDVSTAEGEVVGIRAASVSAWYEEHIVGAAPPLRFELLAGGHSNLTYRVTAAAAATVSRPPTGAVLATAHDMAREPRSSPAWPASPPSDGPPCPCPRRSGCAPIRR